ncbi:MAG: transporter substrate-binding domain-containing protein [Deltaproteobacteria bacterium]|nr:transporter substrate-binding domain-containing protein [Deltaproteobacteria bacterium]
MTLICTKPASGRVVKIHRSNRPKPKNFPAPKRFLSTYLHWFILLTLLTALPVFGSEPPHPAPVRTVTVVADDNSPPYLFRDANGRLQGILADEWRLWEEKTGVKVYLWGMAWDKALKAMGRGDAEVIDTIFKTPGREQNLAFTEPYATLDVAVFFHKSISGIVDVESLQGFTVGVKSEDACIEFLTKNGINTLQEYPSYETLMQAAAGQKIKVFCMDVPAAHYYLYRLKLEKEYRQTAPLYQGQFHRAVPNGRTDLLKLVETGFSKISAAEYEAIRNRWIGSPIPIHLHNLIYLFYAMGLIVALGGGLLMWNRSLRRNVAIKTARLRRTISALQKSEVKYRELLENANSIILRLDTFGRVTFFNEFAQKFFGFDEKEILGRDLFGTILPETGDGPDPGRAMVEAIVSHPDRYANHVMKNIRHDGQKVWIAWTDKLVYGSDGQLKEILCIGNDITERRLSEQEATDWKQRFEIIAAAAGQVVYDLNIADRLVTWSGSTEKVLGYPLSEITGDLELWESLIEPCDLEETLRRLESSLKEGTPFLAEYGFRHKDGRYVRMMDKGYVMLDPAGKPERMIGIMQDVTDLRRMEREREQLEERLRRAEKMEAMGTLAGGVAHDLNNVLGVLVGYSELLAEKIPEGNPLRRYVLNILNSGEKGAAIIQDLLTMARRGVAVSEVVNLNAVITDYLRTLEFERLAAHHRNVDFETRLADDLLSIKGSPVHLGKTVMNLVSNGAEAITGQGKVTILTENCYLDRHLRGYDDVQAGDYAVLTVSDTGQGISEADRERIFEPFYTKKAMGRSGTGLGLTVVWGTVKDHRGYIDVQSDGHKGSTFILYFPVTREKPAGEPKPLPEKDYLGRGEKILVVDDVEEQRELAVNMLEGLGYRVAAVSGGEEALARLKTEPAALLVLDMIMDPGIDGLETYRRALEIHPGQKAVLVSGFSETERVRMAQELGAGAYVRKPYVQRKIGQAVRQELDR